MSATLLEQAMWQQIAFSKRLYNIYMYIYIYTPSCRDVPLQGAIASMLGVIERRCFILFRWQTSHWTSISQACDRSPLPINKLFLMHRDVFRIIACPITFVECHKVIVCCVYKEGTYSSIILLLRPCTLDYF